MPTTAAAVSLTLVLRAGEGLADTSDLDTFSGLSKCAPSSAKKNIHSGLLGLPFLWGSWYMGSSFHYKNWINSGIIHSQIPPMTNDLRSECFVIASLLGLQLLFLGYCSQGCGYSSMSCAGKSALERRGDIGCLINLQ